MDFIFGTFATDALKMVHHRASHRGLQHGYALSPRDPLPGQAVKVKAVMGIDAGLAHVACYYTTDGSAPIGGRGVAQNGEVIRLQKTSVDWDTVAWGYTSNWEGVLPAFPEGTQVRYRLSAWSEGGEEIFADWPHAQEAAELAAAAFFRNEPLPTAPPGDPLAGNDFSFRVDTLQPPEWASRAVIYHIFVDRFYPGDGKTWAQPDSLSGFYGGTLWGVRDKLDYIQELGVNCIWLSPIWESPTHHGYDVTDYDHIAARYGGNDALHALVEAAHGRGIRVLLDMVCNHISDQHPIFQEALSNPASPYRDWFTFDDSSVGYRAFFGVSTMPEINVANPEARRWLLDIARYWLREFKVDGYRLDYANGPGPDFWSDFRAACREENPNCLCFGEIVDQPEAMLPYVGRLDGCLDFHLAEVLRFTFARKTLTLADLERFLDRHQAYLSQDGAFILPTFLDNHDMNRFLYIAGGDKDILKAAAAFQMRLPNPPIIYYGTEVGLSQAHDKDEVGLEASREPMLWGDAQDKDLLAYYQALIRARS